ncbi:envelope-like protein, partial [Trifolium medium]|nr:envelope-like protein [Trifolium medium]
IGTTNWVPINHGSGITPMLAKIIYLIGTKRNLNFGEYVFTKIMKHAESYAVKLPIAFPCLISSIILSQHPDILHPGEKPSQKPAELTIDDRLFAGSHVLDIVIPKEIGESSAPLTKGNIKSSGRDHQNNNHGKDAHGQFNQTHGRRRRRD